MGFLINKKYIVNFLDYLSYSVEARLGHRDLGPLGSYVSRAPPPPFGNLAILPNI